MKKNAEKKSSKTSKKKSGVSTPLIIGIVIAAALILINQWQLGALTTEARPEGTIFVRSAGSEVNLDDVDITQIQNTAQAVAAVIDLDGVTDAQSAINKMVPTGTPDYGAAMGVSFDDPVKALQKLSKSYYNLKPQMQNNPELWKRYLNLAARPTGISCEFCCGVGPQGITADGQLKCGCAHNPGAQAVTMWLMMNTDYTDAEVLREVLKWKTIWFPKDMVKLGMQIAGGDASALNSMPGMVGGC